MLKWARVKHTGYISSPNAILAVLILWPLHTLPKPLETADALCRYPGTGFQMEEVALKGMGHEMVL